MPRLSRVSRPFGLVLITTYYWTISTVVLYSHGHRGQRALGQRLASRQNYSKETPLAKMNQFHGGARPPACTEGETVMRVQLRVLLPGPGPGQVRFRGFPT